MVRAAIRRLPPHHPGRWYFENSAEMSTDAAIVDTFLHSQDTAYSVRDLLDFVERNGMKFQGWLDAALYNQDLEGIDRSVLERERWSIVENFSARMTTHYFIACRPERDPRSNISFNGDEWLGYFPQRHPALQPSMWQQGKWVRGPYEFVPSESEIVLLSECNGRRSVSDLLKHKLLAKTPLHERRELARSFYERMWRLGHVFFSAEPIKSTAGRAGANPIASAR